MLVGGGGGGGGGGCLVSSFFEVIGHWFQYKAEDRKTEIGAVKPNSESKVWICASAELFNRPFPLPSARRVMEDGTKLQVLCRMMMTHALL